MKFWAIAYVYQEDIYYNVEAGESRHSLTEACLLPTEELATKIINEELDAGFVPVEINLETLSENGVYSWSRGTVDAWDANYTE